MLLDKSKIVKRGKPSDKSLTFKRIARSWNFGALYIKRLCRKEMRNPKENLRFQLLKGSAKSLSLVKKSPRKTPLILNWLLRKAWASLELVSDLRSSCRSNLNPRLRAKT